MDRDQIFVFVVIVCIFNGLFSPWLLVAVVNAPAWMPGFIPYSPQLLFYGASLLVSSLTLLVSGVPAALVERFLKDEVSPAGVLWIWLAAAGLLSIPAFEQAIARL